MRQTYLSMLIATVLLIGAGCEPDYCSCSHKHPVAYLVPLPEPVMWSPVGDPENDARIAKLLHDKCVAVSLPLRPERNSGFQPIEIPDLPQLECAERLLLKPRHVAKSRWSSAILFPLSTIGPARVRSILRGSIYGNIETNDVVVGFAAPALPDQHCLPIKIVQPKRQ